MWYKNNLALQQTEVYKDFKQKIPILWIILFVYVRIYLRYNAKHLLRCSHSLTQMDEILN